jgi:hypothetical protein
LHLAPIGVDLGAVVSGGATRPRIGGVLQTTRNVAIILLLALAVDLLPGGGEAAEAMLQALTMAFMAAIGWLVYRLYRDQELTIAGLTDSQRAGLFGSVGAIALLFVGYDEFQSFAGGVLLWIALMAGAVAAIFLIWRSTTSYS